MTSTASTPVGTLNTLLAVELLKRMDRRARACPQTVAPTIYTYSILVDCLPSRRAYPHPPT
ncbi:hypothetical protein [Oryza sativa Japonica Group]|uniref:Uncharacterized protein P0702H08.13 n=1 Tax=Oryza sativa subsp. japonica TaxID=39947 RepID=Q5JM29_ORYSJ|nr:hypothetical protein [Oryza sativa Japonica Group]